MLGPDVFAFAVIFCVSIDAAPLFSPPDTDPNAPGSIFDVKNVVPYLTSYGYYDARSTNSSGAESLADSLKKLQRFAGINVTGRLDEQTVTLLRTQRCGRNETEAVKQMSGKNRRKRFYLQGSYWENKDLTYRILTFTEDLPKAVIKREIQTAFDLWSHASTLSIKEETDPTVPDENVDILISFVRGRHFDSYPFDGPGGTLAHAYYPHNNKGLSGDAHFDDDERFTSETSEGINFLWVAVHEFGHSIGLEHSNVRESIMYPWYNGYKKDITLTLDDIHGIQAIYGQPIEIPTTPGASTTETAQISTTPGASTTERTISPTTEASTTAAPTISTTAPTTVPLAEDICKLPNWDATLERPNGQVHVLRGVYYWILSRNLGVESGPLKIDVKWKELVTPVDATYTRPDGKSVFFAGLQYWIYRKDDTLESGPNPIADFGLPGDVEQVDGAFIYGPNKKTYLFHQDLYWRYNEETQAMDSGYPRPLSVWGKAGLPSGIGTVMTWPRNGRTYFFVGRYYYRLNDGSLNIDPNYPREVGKVWAKCAV